MSSVSYTLLGHEMSLNYTGEKVRADAFYGNTDGLHTLSITANNFTGHVVIEGTLSSSPTENDWFPIKLDWTNKWATFNDVPVVPPPPPIAAVNDNDPPVTFELVPSFAR